MEVRGEKNTARGQKYMKQNPPQTPGIFMVNSKFDLFGDFRPLGAPDTRMDVAGGVGGRGWEISFFNFRMKNTVCICHFCDFEQFL